MMLVTFVVFVSTSSTRRIPEKKWHAHSSSHAAVSWPGKALLPKASKLRVCDEWALCPRAESDHGEGCVWKSPATMRHAS